MDQEVQEQVPKKSEEGCMMAPVFTAILWPPAAKHFDQIEQEVLKQYKISDSTTYKFGKDEFRKFMVKTYKPDKTPSSRVHRKYKAMAKFPRYVRTFNVSIPDATMKPHKKKRLHGKIYCSEAKRLKSHVRSIFAPKIKGYIYDILMHISDNEDHNKRTAKLLKRYGKKVEAKQ